MFRLRDEIKTSERAAALGRYLPLTTWKGRLMANDSLAAQAKNNPEEQFAIGTFKFESTDVVIESQDAQNSIAAPMLKKPQIFVGDESAKQLTKYA